MKIPREYLTGYMELQMCYYTLHGSKIIGENLKYNLVNEYWLL